MPARFTGAVGGGLCCDDQPQCAAFSGGELKSPEGCKIRGAIGQQQAHRETAVPKGCFHGPTGILREGAKRQRELLRVRKAADPIRVQRPQNSGRPTKQSSLRTKAEQCVEEGGLTTEFMDASLAQGWRGDKCSCFVHGP